MDWWVWVLVIVVLGVVALGVWWSSGRTPKHVEPRGGQLPDGDEGQFHFGHGGHP
jgi:hypothetical protein